MSASIIAEGRASSKLDNNETVGGEGEGAETVMDMIVNVVSRKMSKWKISRMSLNHLQKVP